MLQDQEQDDADAVEGAEEASLEGDGAEVIALAAKVEAWVWLVIEDDTVNDAKG